MYEKEKRKWKRPLAKLGDNWTISEISLPQNINLDRNFSDSPHRMDSIRQSVDAPGGK